MPQENPTEFDTPASSEAPKRRGRRASVTADPLVDRLTVKITQQFAESGASGLLDVPQAGTGEPPAEPVTPEMPEAPKRKRRRSARDFQQQIGVMKLLVAQRMKQTGASDPEMRARIIAGQPGSGLHLSDLRLSPRTQNFLENTLGIGSVMELLHFRMAELLSIPNFGEKGVAEVYSRLAAAGLYREQTENEEEEDDEEAGEEKVVA